MDPYKVPNFMSIFSQSNEEWTREEDKLFEYALVLFDKDTPDRWVKVAAVLQTKTVSDVIKRYEKLEEDVCGIEERRISLPGYLDSSLLPLELVCNHNYEGTEKRPPTRSTCENEKKKRLHWSKDEHLRFLEGIQNCGEGKWRDIARKFVGTRTPTQVASHAQKYFIRQNLSKEGKGNKRRASIHDITTLNIIETTTQEEDKPYPFQDQSQMSSPHLNQTSMEDVELEWIDHDCDDTTQEEDKSHPLQQEQSQMPSQHLNQFSNEDVELEWIDELLMEIFDQDNDAPPQSPSNKMDFCDFNSDSFWEFP